jgi:SulP family sulfate permease
VPGKALDAARLDPSPVVEVLPDFDAALERAEELLLAGAPDADEAGPAWLGADASAGDEATFLGYLAPVALAAGETLFREGDASEEMYFVQRGGLDVVKATDSGPLRLAKVRAGSMLGEMALYTGQVRSASAVATEPCELRVLTRAARERLQREHPQVAALLDRQVVTGLAGAVQRANALLKLQAG